MWVSVTVPWTMANLILIPELDKPILSQQMRHGEHRLNRRARIRDNQPLRDPSYHLSGWTRCSGTARAPPLLLCGKRPFRVCLPRALSLVRNFVEKHSLNFPALVLSH
jgi:hypothetical protein